MPSQSGAVIWAMPKVVRWIVTLREPAVGVPAQAPISALSATQLAASRNGTTVFFRVAFMRSGYPVYSFAAILLAAWTRCHLAPPEQTRRLGDVRARHVLNASGGGLRSPSIICQTRRWRPRWVRLKQPLASDRKWPSADNVMSACDPLLSVVRWRIRRSRTSPNSYERSLAARLLNQVVRPRQHRWRNGEAEV